MKRFLLFVFAIVAFAACEHAPIEEQSAIRYEAPDTITVGFEGDDTRIQLNEAQKTVWNSGDEVSVFYRTNGNQKWQYTGEDGVRQANLSCVQDATGDTAITKTIVVYPYNETYWLNTDSYCIEATTPATQHYAVDSYGVGDNLMVSQGEFTQISLKNVYGWLKLQITGDGEVVKSITFKGNDGEQVAGLIYVDTATAEATLAAEMGDADDNNAGGNLVFEDTILTEVILDCGEGVTLGKEATAFYIALPPQTFDDGFTVEVACVDGSKMVKSSNKALSIERNHIQPMAAKEYAPSVPNNQIWYTSSNGKVVTPDNTNAFGANIISNEYNNGKGVITFDGDVTSIGYDAFWNCKSLTSVTIPDSVTSIGDSAFRYCSSIKEFKGKFATEDGRSLIVDNTIIAYANASGATYTIPDSVTTIGSWAFENCDSLTSVNITDSVTTIGRSAFDSCDRLTSVTIGDSVTTIGSSAFDYCDSLTSVNIPDSVTLIGDYAFFNCDSLISVYCYATVPPSLGSRVYDNNASRRRIYVYEECVELYKSAWSDYKDSIYTNGENSPEATTIQYTTNDGNIVTTQNMPVVSNIYENGVGTLVVVGKIALIPKDAFRDCTSLTSVTIPDSVTTIGEYAFCDCDSLTSVNIPDSVTSIGEYAFNGCDSLTSVNIPDSVTTIGSYAFYSCKSLTSVNIGDSVTTIGSQAFYLCTSLTSVNIPDSVTEIGEWAFCNCTSLTSVNIPDSVTTIRRCAFACCTSLKEFKGKFAEDNGRILVVDGVLAAFAPTGITEYTIPDIVTKIGRSAFAYCDSLTSVTIPNSVRLIEYGAFYSCDSLTSVYFKAKTPPAVEWDVFDYNGSGRKIYVPAGSVNAYKSATNWSEYRSAIVGYDYENGVVVE